MRSKYEDPDFDDRMVEYSEEDSDDERPKAKARKQAAPKAGGGAQRKAPKRPAGTVTLRGLIEEGLLAPADDVLTVEYKGMITHASLTAEGRIRFKDMYFDSPSAFSIYLKRLVNPTRKADDGWKTVKYAGKLLETFKMEFFMRRFGGLEGAPPGVAAAAGLGPNAGMPPTKRARTNAAAAAAAAAGGGFDDPAAAGLGGSGSSSVGGPPTTLRQLAPRGRGSGQPTAGFRGGPGAAAAAGGSSSMGGGGGAGFRSEHTPRPVDLGSMVPAEHDFAPREGELAGMAEQEVVALTPGAPRHFMSGVELEAVTNGLPTPSSSEAPYTPAQPTPAADQQQAPQQQQQPGSEADAAAAAAADESEGAAGGGTVAASRPRRAIKMPQRLINSAAMADRDGHDMVRCEGYPVGPPGCGAPGAQPYRVAVSPIAEVMMDFHAHLDRNEIIGLLAGSWDPQQRLLRVERAFPVREAMGGNAENDGINVEMDPEDQFKVTEVINELYGMRVVGWYHSHPSFPALPSVIDIANQLQMQHQYKTDEGGVVTEPYIAAIVSPYDRRLPSLQSSVTWFRVEQGSPAAAAAAAAAAAGGVGAAAGAVAAAAGRLTFTSNKDAVDQGAVPVELAIERLLRRSTPDALVKLIPALIITAQRYAAKRSAPNLTSSWKPPTLAVAAAAAATAGEVAGGAAGAAAAAAAAGSNGAGGGQTQGPGQTLVNTRLIKLMGSLKAWWPGNATAEQCQEFCNALKRALLQSRVLVAVPGLVDSPPQQQQQQQPRPPVALSGPAAAAAAAALAAALPSAGGAQLLPQLQQQVVLLPPMQQQQQQQYLASSLQRVLAAGATGSSKAGSAGSSPNAASAAAAAAAAAAAMAAAVAAAQPSGPSRLAAALMGQAADASTGGAAALEGTDAVAGMQQQLPPQQQQQQGDDEATATETEDEADAAVPGPPPLSATEAAAEQGLVAGDVSLFAPVGQVGIAAAEPAPPVAAATQQQQQQDPAEDADEATEDEADAQ